MSRSLTSRWRGAVFGGVARAWTERVLVGASPTVALAGCGSLETSSVQTGPLAPAHGSGVYLVMADEPVPDGFEEIALVQAKGSGRRASPAEVLEGLSHLSRSLGCTHVARVRVDEGMSVASATGVCGRVRLR